MSTALCLTHFVGDFSGLSLLPLSTCTRPCLGTCTPAPSLHAPCAPLARLRQVLAITVHVRKYLATVLPSQHAKTASSSFFAFPLSSLPLFFLSLFSSFPHCTLLHLQSDFYLPRNYQRVLNSITSTLHTTATTPCCFYTSRYVTGKAAALLCDLLCTIVTFAIPLQFTLTFLFLSPIALLYLSLHACQLLSTLSGPNPLSNSLRQQPSAVPRVHGCICHSPWLRARLLRSASPLGRHRGNTKVSLLHATHWVRK